MPHYLGNPLTTGMIKLPYVLRGYDMPFDRHITQTSLIAGGTATASQLDVRRLPTLSWRALSQSEASTVLGFYTRAWGAGPYVLVDTSFDNQLREDTSLCGVRRGVLTGWVATGGGTIVYDGTVAGNVAPAGVMRWAGAGSSSAIGEGTAPGGVFTADPAKAAPYLSDQAVTCSIYAKLASGSASLKMRVSGRNAAGASVSAVDSSSTALNTSTWTRVSMTATVGALGASVLVVPVVLCQTAAAPNILMTNPQLQYASSATTWVIGHGTPRCLPIGTAPNPINVVGEGRDLTLTLAEI